MRSFWLPLLGLSIVVSLTSCDEAPGNLQEDRKPPSLTEFSYSPATIQVEELDPSQFSGDNVLIPLNLSVRLSDEDATATAVRYTISAPDDPTGLYRSGVLAGSGSGMYEESVDLPLPVALIGTYWITVFAETTGGVLSNQVRGSIRLTAAANDPPVIESIEAPDTFTPPASLVLAATVSDPQGLANILRVTVTAPNGGVFDLVDDGRTFDDEVAGDGKYSGKFDVTSASPGPQVFSFQAFDRGGAESEIVDHTITITGSNDQ